MRIEIKGETLDEAINNAMIELATTSDNVAYELIQEGSSGFLGIGAKPFIIEAYKKDDKEENYKKTSENKKEKLVENEKGVYEFKTEKVSTNKGLAKKNEKMTRDPETVFNEVKATENIRKIEENTEKKIKEREDKLSEQVKKTEEANKFYFDNENPDSLFAKANMVQKYNEKHNK